jgi:hypothetical protein
MVITIYIIIFITSFFLVYCHFRLDITTHEKDIFFLLFHGEDKCQTAATYCRIQSIEGTRIHVSSILYFVAV